MPWDVAIRSLDHRATEYALDHLRDVNVLCTALHEVVAHEEGETFTLAPTTTPIEKLYRFQEGGLLPTDWSQAHTLPEGQGTLVPIPSLVDNRAQRILEVLRAPQGRYCIVDDCNPRWGDTGLNLGPRAFGVGEEVYHLLTGSVDIGTISQVLRDGRTFWHGVAAVCTSAPTISAAREATSQDLRKSAAGVVEITLTAYDSEGFIIWRRAEK